MLCRTTTHPPNKGTVFLIPQKESIVLGIAHKPDATKPTTELQLSINDANEMIAVLCSFALGMQTEEIYRLHDAVVKEVEKITSINSKKLPN